VAGHRGGPAQADEQVGLAGARVADQAERFALLTQPQVASSAMTAGWMCGFAA